MKLGPQEAIESGAAFLWSYKAAKAQAASPVVDRWNEYMTDPETGAQPKLRQVFLLDERRAYGGRKDPPAQ